MLAALGQSSFDSTKIDDEFNKLLTKARKNGKLDQTEVERIAEAYGTVSPMFAEKKKPKLLNELKTLVGIKIDTPKKSKQDKEIEKAKEADRQRIAKEAELLEKQALEREQQKQESRKDGDSDCWKRLDACELREKENIYANWLKLNNEKEYTKLLFSTWRGTLNNEEFKNLLLKKEKDMSLDEETRIYIGTEIARLNELLKLGEAQKLISENKSKYEEVRKKLLCLRGNINKEEILVNNYCSGFKDMIAKIPNLRSDVYNIFISAGNRSYFSLISSDKNIFKRNVTVELNVQIPPFKEFYEAIFSLMDFTEKRKPNDLEKAKGIVPNETFYEGDGGKKIEWFDGIYTKYIQLINDAKRLGKPNNVNLFPLPTVVKQKRQSLINLSKSSSQKPSSQKSSSPIDTPSKKGGGGLMGLLKRKPKEPKEPKQSEESEETIEYVNPMVKQFGKRKSGKSRKRKSIKSRKRKNRRSKKIKRNKNLRSVKKLHFFSV